jgi:tRNA pseudouridine55 synthase
LVVGINRGTKFLPYLDDSKKSYIASLRLGIHSSTGDPGGPLTPDVAVPELTDSVIAAKLASFIGKSEQMPPMTSAIKVAGEELYKAAHRGEEVERKPRAIEIFSIHLIAYQDKTIVFTCTVSRGTYIRVLGEDIAKSLGSVGYLTSLRRLSIGDFIVEKAKKIEELTPADVLDPTLYITTMKHVEIDSADEAKVKNGVPMTLQQDFGEKVLLCFHGNALAVYARTRDIYYHSERGLF